MVITGVTEVHVQGRGLLCGGVARVQPLGAACVVGAHGRVWQQQLPVQARRHRYVLPLALGWHAVRA